MNKTHYSAPSVGETLDVQQGQIGDQVQGDLSKAPDVDLNRPRIKRKYVDLSPGKLSFSTHGGYVVPIAYMEYLAGTTYKKIRIKGHLKMRPLAHTNFDEQSLVFSLCYCPYSKVWDDADKFFSQRTGFLDTPVTEVPGYTPPAGTPAPTLFIGTGLSSVPLYNSTVWQQSISYHLYGNLWAGGSSSFPLSSNFINILPFRAYKACYNDIYRPKEATGAYAVPTSSTPLAAEINQLLRCGRTNQVPVSDVNVSPTESGWMIGRAPAHQHYLNEFRFRQLSSDPSVPVALLSSHVPTQQQMAELRSRASHAELTDEEIIAHLRGTVTAKENMVCEIGSATVPVQFTIQQASSESGLSLGADGAFSYNDIDVTINITSGKRFVSPRDGILMLMARIVTPNSSLFAENYSVEHTKRYAQDYYRPDLHIIKDDPIKEFELIGNYNPGFSNNVVGWKKRKYGEYCRSPHFIRGDFVTNSNLFPDPGNPRTLPHGFIRPPYSYLDPTNPDTTPVALETASAWNMLNSADKMGYTLLNTSTALAVKFDWTDVVTRPFLLEQGPPVLNANYFRIYTNHTYLFDGTYTETKELPIAEEIINEYIGIGEE